MKDRKNTDIYIIIKNFLLIIFIFICAAVLIIGTQYAGDSASYQLQGTKYERISTEEIKNSCISFFDMLK
ncbi:MAG: hypothetical protein IJO68_09225 [Clostridia bacterium]|nr:hypothetical protein [Clostridia bacterium]